MYDSTPYTVCMKGSIHQRKDRGTWLVRWYHAPHRKTYSITRYKGELMYHRKVAEKLLAIMQGDTENGVFRIEKYINQGHTDVVKYLRSWIKTIINDLSPATFKDYSNSIENHLVPFFQENHIYLHEIQYDVLRKLLNTINREGKGKLNVMYCLHACLEYAWRSSRIPSMPPFPEKKYYRIQEKVIEWLPEERQLKILEAIPVEHQPIFYWLKYHLRRPCEAMALHRCDYDKENETFIIRRSISNRKLVERTKTGNAHVIPLHPSFKCFAKFQHKKSIVSQFYFTCKTSRTDGKRYTNSILQRIWKKACKQVGERIPMYSGLKHSSMTQLAVERGFSDSEIQMLSDHARIDSVKKYRKMEVSIKRNLMERTVTQLSPKNKDREKGEENQLHIQWE